MRVGRAPRVPVISRRKQQRALNSLGLEPWRLLASFSAGLTRDELYDIFQEDVGFVNLKVEPVWTAESHVTLAQLSALSAPLSARSTQQRPISAWSRVPRQARSSLRRRLSVADDELVRIDASLLRLATGTLDELRFEIDNPAQRAALYALLAFYGLTHTKASQADVVVTRKPNAPLAAPSTESATAFVKRTRMQQQQQQQQQQ